MIKIDRKFLSIFCVITVPVSVVMKQSCLYFDTSIPTKYIKAPPKIKINALMFTHKLSTMYSRK